MRRGRERSAGDKHERLQQAFGPAQPCEDHQAESDREQQPGTDVPMMPDVRTRVADDANDRCHADEQPFNPLVGEMLQAQKGQQAGRERQQRAVYGARG